eukprot:m.254116 g.254116  ORF g.254116 m.254116 type:complete len:531 (+) comp17707_c0_seq1:3-1595(+)
MMMMMMSFRCSLIATMAFLKVNAAVLSAAVVLLLSSCAFAFEKEDGVIIATDSNFDDVVKQNEFALVEFYAPWCGHCQALAPEYAKAARQLESSGSPVVLVKVDCTSEEKLAERFEIQGFPTLRFFRNGVDSEYSGGRTADEIVAWVTKKSGPAAVDVDDIDAAEALTRDNDVVFFGFFTSKDSVEAKAFLEAAAMSDSTFGLSTNDKVAQHFELKAPAILAVKKFDEPRVVYKDSKTSSDDIAKFVSQESLPLVIEFSDENAPKIFGGNVQVHCLLFVEGSHAQYSDLMTAMAAVAKQYRGKLLFVHIDSSKGDNLRILEYFGINEEDLPTIRIIDLARDMAKYALTGPITTETLSAFADKFFGNKLTRHLRSEEVPEDWDKEAVKVLTGKNFAQVARDSSKNVFVEFYAPWCGHCKQLAPIWDKLGEKFASVDNVVIAKLDATANELEDLSVESFPTLKFFPADSDEVIDYEGGRTLKEFVDFVNEHAKSSVEVSADEAATGFGEADDYGEEPEYGEEAPAGAGHDEL